MPQKSIVIVSHSLDEAITKCIKNNVKNLEADVKMIALQELMSDYEIFDEVILPEKIGHIAKRPI